MNEQETVKIVVISDTHSNHKKLKLQGGDVLIHAGDFTTIGFPEEVANFKKWIKEQDFKYKIVIAGNHDFLLDSSKGYVKDRYSQIMKEFKQDIIYLQDSWVSLFGYKIYGTPWTPLFQDFAFMKTQEELQDIYQQIPQDVDILVSHGPPFGILDQCRTGDNGGCKALLDTVQKIQPLIHMFGHIHEGKGSQTQTIVRKDLNKSRKVNHFDDKILYINASCKDIQEAFILKLPIRDQEISSNEKLRDIRAKM